MGEEEAMERKEVKCARGSIQHRIKNEGLQFEREVDAGLDTVMV